MIRTLRVITVIIAVVVWVIPAMMQDSSGVRVAYTMFDFWHEAQDVFIAGEYCYVAGGASGVWVSDISNPEGYHPEIAHSTIPTDALDVLVVDDLLYVADADYGLWIYDASSPDNLELVGQLETWG